MSLLLHTCCGPCLSGAWPHLKRNGISDIVLFWENPNIHPYVEYHSRFESFKKMAGVLGAEIRRGDVSYGLERFLVALGGDFGPSRCAACFRMRLNATASRARQDGFESFSTTLLISPFQDHDLLVAIGREAGREHGVAFVETDLRPAFPDTHAGARENELYRQKYCGCVFSERDRFAPKLRLAL
ncbi:MAG TPA: epoxyqueuosine reductase QueH [Candidatus Ozemobacteraceae bacterium]|nr:epoxyqueuosine reductase QueH [Candidatus Ozemobacteraceae bacterium]HQG29034.1 epoxyqueuosine reductase QueH [Candidatus Ozemobacteraceae bacterium]